MEFLCPLNTTQYINITTTQLRTCKLPEPKAYTTQAVVQAKHIRHIDKLLTTLNTVYAVYLAV